MTKPYMYFPFRPDIHLTEFLKTHPFTYSAEIIPPRNGAEQMKVLTQVQQLMTAGAQFLSVTKGAGGSLRGGSLPISQLIKEQFKVPCTAHFTCRDLTVQEVENQLVDHHYFGIRNILALRGDPPEGQPEWKPREGGHLYAYQLIEQIRKLNEGIYLERAGGGPTHDSTPEKTQFCIGAAAYPDYPDEKRRIEYFKLKVEAGAHFAITDMIYDSDSYARFLDQTAREGAQIPILPGARVLKSQKQALRMMSKFKTVIPKNFFNQLPEEEIEGSFPQALDAFLQLVERLKRAGAPGIHLFVVVDTQSAVIALQTLTGSSL